MSTTADTLEDKLEEDYRKWQVDIKARERVIARNGGHDLDVLAAAGVDRNVLLKLLALAPSRDRTWTGIMRQRQAALKSLSRRMDTLAREAKQRARDPLSVVQFWAYTSGGWGDLGMKLPGPMIQDPGIALVISGMVVLAKRMKEQARRFGRYLKAYGRADVGVVLLLVRYRMFRPKMDHFNELARLLTDAFEAAGMNKSFSADGLRKTYKRHGRSFLGLWLMFNTPPPQAPPDAMPPRVPYRSADSRGLAQIPDKSHPQNFPRLSIRGGGIVRK